MSRRGQKTAKCSDERLTLCFGSGGWQIGKNVFVLALYILILFVEVFPCTGVGALGAGSKGPLDIRGGGAGGGGSVWVLVARVEVGSVGGSGGGGPPAGGVGAGHGRWAQQCRAQSKAKLISICVVRHISSARVTPQGTRLLA